MSLSLRHVSLAQARKSLESGQYGDVERICQTLVKQNKADADALHMLGAVALQVGNLDEAEKIFQRALKLRPNDAPMRVNLGKAQLRSGNALAAIKSFEEALKLRPGMDMAIAGKADSFNFLGDVAQARAILEPLVREKSEGPDAAFIYGTLLDNSGEHRDAIDLFVRHLSTPVVNGLERYRMGLLLGKSHESLGEFDQAFDAYSSANDVGARFSKFNREGYSEWVGKVIAMYDRARIEEYLQWGSDSDLPIFIVGMPRSGSTLIEQIIQSHPQVHGAGEVAFLEQIPPSMSSRLKSSLRYPDCMAQFDRQACARVSHDYLSQLRATNRQATRIVDKNLLNYQHIGLISILFPKARVVHCLRDALDTCLSCFTSPLAPNKHGYSTNLEQLGEFFREYQRFMAHWRTVPTTPILEVQYEELVANQEQMSRKIIDFCGLLWDDKCLKYYESKRVVRTISYDQVRRPIYDKSIGRAKNFQAHLKPLDAAIRGTTS